MPFADGAKLRAELSAQVLTLLGPRTEADDAAIAEARSKPKSKPSKAKKAPAPSAKKDDAPATDGTDGSDVPLELRGDPFAFLPRPEENNAVHTTVNFSDGSVMRIANSKEQLEAHLKRTGGKHYTRFPPEPNGYLHIGHAKAMFIDFGMAERYGGVCYLRFDDTNPEAEKQEFIDHIQDIGEWVERRRRPSTTSGICCHITASRLPALTACNNTHAMSRPASPAVAWMGWKPWKITHASHYFQELYELAVKLIKIGKAYVCHQTGDEIAASREKREPSPWRDTPGEVEEEEALRGRGRGRGTAKRERDVDWRVGEEEGGCENGMGGRKTWYERGRTWRSQIRYDQGRDGRRGKGGTIPLRHSTNTREEREESDRHVA